MLILINRPGQLRFGELMAVYRQSCEEVAAKNGSLSHGFALEAAEQDFRQYLREVFFRTPGAVLAVWEEAGRYVCAARLEPYRDGLLLAGVETAPDCRRMGFASALICQIQKLLPQLGTSRLYSHVGRQNAASLALHESCGFRVISEMAVYLDGSVDRRCVTLRYDK